MHVITRVSRLDENPNGVSEYPHVTASQARGLDYFAEVMANAPTRIRPNYGLEFQSLEIAEVGKYPVTIKFAHGTGEKKGLQRVVRAKYVVGADGTYSRVRQAINGTLSRSTFNHAWGVSDVLAVTDSPDVRIKCEIQSESRATVNK